MENDLLIYKTNSLIEASYRLTLDEIRVLALTIGTMNPKSDQQVFDFTVADFIAKFPDVTEKNAYNQIQNAINRIYDRSVRTEDAERVTKFRWVSSQTYFKSEGRFRIALTNEVMPYLTQLKGQFTQYQLRHISSFNSVHAIRIYELCTQYKTMGEREITVEKLKEWLQVEGNYSRWGNFKMRVLEPSLKEINSKSDLLVSVELIKKGRSIHAIKFDIKPKKVAKTIETEPKRPPLPKRPAVKANSHEEGVYHRECIARVREFWLNHYQGEEWQDILPKLPTSELKLLHKWHKKLGNDFSYKPIEKILDSRA